MGYHNITYFPELLQRLKKVSYVMGLGLFSESS